jgi:hypothetical protein
MADAVDQGRQKRCRKCSAFRARSATTTQQSTHAQTARRSSKFRQRFATMTPSRPHCHQAASAGLRPAQKRRPLHTLFTMRKSLMVWPMWPHRSSPDGCGPQPAIGASSASRLRQPPRKVAATLAASAVSESESENEGGKAFRNRAGSSFEMPSGSDRLMAQSARGGGCDGTLQPWRERPRLWPRA